MVPGRGVPAEGERGPQPRLLPRGNSAVHEGHPHGPSPISNPAPFPSPPRGLGPPARVGHVSLSRRYKSQSGYRALCPPRRLRRQADLRCTAATRNLLEADLAHQIAARRARAAVLPWTPSPLSPLKGREATDPRFCFIKRERNCISRQLHGRLGSPWACCETHA